MVVVSDDRWPLLQAVSRPTMGTAMTGARELAGAARRGEVRMPYEMEDEEREKFFFSRAAGERGRPTHLNPTAHTERIVRLERSTNLDFFFFFNLKAAF